MKVGELIEELKKYPKEADVMYDMFETRFFGIMRKACGRDMEIPDGEIRSIRAVDPDGPVCDCIVFLEEAGKK